MGWGDISFANRSLEVGARLTFYFVTQITQWVMVVIGRECGIWTRDLRARYTTLRSFLAELTPQPVPFSLNARREVVCWRVSAQVCRAESRLLGGSMSWGSGSKTGRGDRVRTGDISGGPECSTTELHPCQHTAKHKQHVGQSSKEVPGTICILPKGS